MKTMQDYINDIKAKFADGHRVVEIATSQPEGLRRNLYKAVKLRGLPWRFALTENSVVVARRKA